jgi:hypothetical protein
VLGRDQPGLLNEIIGVAFVANQGTGDPGNCQVSFPDLDGREWSAS